jgi:hypothetical protein
MVSIDDYKNTDIEKSFLNKSIVKQHVRKTKSGKVAIVKQYTIRNKRYF